METISRTLLTFLLNTLWQVPLAAAVAALACRFLRNGPAAHRHTIWVVALAAATFVPLSSIRIAPPPIEPPFVISAPDVPLAGARPATHWIPPARASAASALNPRTVSFAETPATIVLAAYLCFLLFGLARLARASFRTLQIRRSAHAEPIPAALERVLCRSQEAFGLRRVDLLFSAQIPGPISAGRAIILPESLLGELSEDVLSTAIGHEMAHIARHDFACHLACELLGLIIAFHPASWIIRARITRTREIACDEMVTGRLIDADRYARAIMSIAAGIVALPSPGYTLGVFDGDILEERIRRLARRPAANFKRARVLLVAALSALAVCAVIASNLALTAHAQSGASSFIQEGKAAAGRGDFAAATAQFERAVVLEPANVQARLLLADTLVQRKDPAAARAQYINVLERDPGNHQAIRGMVIVNTDTKQYAEAREWATKAVQAEATDKTAYYMAGVLDWLMTYPDYAKARQQAGMQPQDPGIIPDANLRQAMRTEHMAQIQDGLQMLQTALHLDPGYADAMAYMNLLYRINAGIVDTNAESATLIATADSWVGNALAAKRQQAGGSNAISEPWQLAPPPPPPPPPPPGMAHAAAAAPQALHVESSVQAAKRIGGPAPTAPAGSTGVVRLAVVIGKDGNVENIQVVSGPPSLVPPAIEAVRQWVYRPTLIAGEPVEVVTAVNVPFGQ